jgi:uncharacterized damage-inducible protein DinB
MNPYAQFLGDRDPLEVISATTEQLVRLAGSLGPERIARPIAAGKWSVHQIICHLADCESVFAVRLRQTAAQPHHVIQPFDQDDWARNYESSSTADALAVFSALRRWNIALIRNAGPDLLAKPVTHPERGTMTFQTIVETIAGHDRNHLAQIESVASQSASA